MSGPLETQFEGAVCDLCVVVPAHNEEENVPILFAELKATLENNGISFEVIFVDDGSKDGIRDAISRLAGQHHTVRGVILSRNFGHQAAVSIGLRYARGRAVAVMDADLQDRPQDLLELYRRWLTGVDVAYATRRTRKEGLLLRTAYRLFYRSLASIAAIEIPVDSGDFCVMDGKFVATLNELPERQRYVRGLRAWVGGKQVAVPVDRDPRRAGSPSYSVAKLVRLAVDGFVSFSYVPLRIASVAGVLVSALAFVGVLVVLAWKVMGLLPRGAAVATIALSVLFLGGVQLLTIGVLGEYVGRIFDEVKARPVAVVADVIEPAEPSKATASPRAPIGDTAERE